MMRPPEPPSMSTSGSQKSRLEKNHNYIRVKREVVATADGESDEEESKEKMRDRKAGASDSSSDLDSIEDYVEKVVYVKTKKVGYLIGTNGRTIWGFENNSGAKIDIMKPNSRDNETPILLSGTADSVKNVLRMITDLYHMNNFTSQMWHHFKRSAKSDDGNGGKTDLIFGHEEMLVPTRMARGLVEHVPEIEDETGVTIEVGREREDCQGYLPIGLLGTAEENYKAEQMIKEKLAQL